MARVHPRGGAKVVFVTILDELAALARARNFGHGPLELPLCAISKFPVAWCGGCRAGHHTPRVRPEAVARSLMAGVDEARSHE